MFTFGKRMQISVKFLRESDTGVMDVRSLEALSKSLPQVQIEDGTIEKVVARVLKTTFGVGQKSLENLVHQTARSIAQSLTPDEAQLLSDIRRPDGGLFWDGVQGEAMKNIFLSRRRSLEIIDSFDALYR